MLREIIILKAIPLVPPGLTEPVSEQPGATWKQHTNQTIISSTTPLFQSSVQKQVTSLLRFISFSPFQV